MKSIFLFVFSALLLGGTSIPKKSVVTSDSTLIFMVVNMGFREVTGTFSGMTGDIQFDQNNLDSCNFNVCVETSTIDTENEKRDEKLRSKEFFEVAKYPTICFQSTSFVKTSVGLMVTGKLSMHGKTKVIEIPFTASNGTYKGSFLLKRLDYRVGKTVSTKKVSDDVIVQIVCRDK